MGLQPRDLEEALDESRAFVHSVVRWANLVGRGLEHVAQHSTGSRVKGAALYGARAAQSVEQGANQMLGRPARVSRVSGPYHRR